MFYFNLNFSSVPEPKNSFFKPSTEENQTIRILKRSLAVLSNIDKNDKDLKALSVKVMQVHENLNTIPIHKRRINARRYDMTKEACNDITKSVSRVARKLVLMLY